MRKNFYLSAALLILALAFSAAAHPLGNFSVNHYSRIEVEKSKVKLRAVLDMAEIPTFQESQAIDADKNNSLSDEELNLYAERITPDYISNLRCRLTVSRFSFAPSKKTSVCRRVRAIFRRCASSGI
jgi:DNA-binding transcriptional regulator YiaG